MLEYLTIRSLWSWVVGLKFDLWRFGVKCPLDSLFVETYFKEKEHDSDQSDDFEYRIEKLVHSPHDKAIIDLNKIKIE